MRNSKNREITFMEKSKMIKSHFDAVENKKQLIKKLSELIKLDKSEFCLMCNKSQQAGTHVYKFRSESQKMINFYCCECLKPESLENRNKQFKDVMTKKESEND